MHRRRRSSPERPRRRSLLLLLAGGLGLAAPVQAAPDPPATGVFGTIPLFWGEAAGPAEVLSGAAPPHWARDLLERDGPLIPLAMLDGAQLAGLTRLVIAQPRAFSPQENVALDRWVRAGGRLLLFADPLLTGESVFALGDRRRPQDVVLLSPLLRHWGLELLFDPAQPEFGEPREIAGTPLPTSLAGHFAILPADTACKLQAADLLAECRVGAGRAVVLADAALLDIHHPPPGSAEALAALLAFSFAEGAAMAENSGLSPGASDAEQPSAPDRLRDMP